MPMTEEELALVRKWVGDTTPPTDEDLNVIFDRLKKPEAVVEEVLTKRLADILANPTILNFGGRYSRSFVKNVDALGFLIERLYREYPGLKGGTLARVTSASRTVIR